MKNYDLTKDEWDYINSYLQTRGLPVDRNLTFNDIPLPDTYSEVRSRDEIISDVHAFETELYPGITIGIPMVLANMVCVAGVDAIVAVQREGGLGIPPQMLDLKDRLEMLERIGRAESAYIDNPLTISPDKTLAEAKQLMDKFGIYSLVVVDAEYRPIGILSTRDWRYEDDNTKTVATLMGRRRNGGVYSAPKNISFEDAGQILRKHRIEKLPLVDKHDRLVALITAHGLFYKHHHPRSTGDGKGRFLKVGSVGVGRSFTADHLKQVEAQVRKGICMLLIDTARAFSINAKEAVEGVRKRFPKLPLIVGNTATPEGAKALFEWGADIVKVGIGPGEACRTRQIGIGIPQLSEVARCSAIAERFRKEGRNAAVIADGGIKNPGDTAKAIIAGAAAVMTGRLFAGTVESAADTDVDDDGRRIKEYVGSASFKAQRDRISHGTLDKKRRPEGVAKLVPVIGTIADVVNEHIGGLASMMSMQGVRTINELRLKGKFALPQTTAGLFEGIKKK